jgi:hypothetical protein
MLGIGGMTFDDRQVKWPRAAKVVQQFARMWHMSVGSSLTSSVEEGKPSLSSHEDAVRRIFTPSLMESLAQFVGWSACIRNNTLVLWRGRGFARADARPSLIEEAAGFRDALLAHAQPTEAEECVPALPGDVAYIRVQRLTGIMLGGVIGTFVGLVSGFALFGSIDLDFDTPFPLVAALFFGLLFGGAASGCLVGIVLGRFLSARIRVPRSSQDARDPALPLEATIGGGWTFGGMFCGFALGGLTTVGVMAAIERLIGLNNLPFCLWVALFFAWPILGLLVGAIIGRRTGLRRAARGTVLL